jgi:hypothetical protein
MQTPYGQPQPYAQNPYAAPQAAAGAPAAYGPVPGRVEGTTLVLTNGATLPDVCVKCGVTHGIERRHQKFAFVPMWARFFGPLIQRMFMKQSEFYLPICGACNAQWKKWNWFAGLSWVPGFLFFMLGSAIGDSVGGALASLGFLGMFVALIVTLFLRSRKVVAATKIDASHSWLDKIHPTALQLFFQPQAAAPAYAQQQAYPQQGYAQQGYPQGYPQA